MQQEEVSAVRDRPKKIAGVKHVTNLDVLSRKNWIVRPTNLCVKVMGHVADVVPVQIVRICILIVWIISVCHVTHREPGFVPARMLNIVIVRQVLQNVVVRS